MPGRAAAVVVSILVCGLSWGSLGLGSAACGCSRPARNLDLDAIRVSSDARMRTDTVGDGKFASTATFVLVDAENTAGDGAYITLGGELTDSTGTAVGELKSQSLWVPGHESRTFALVDRERVARPTSTSARVKIQGALIPDEPPRVHVADLHAFDDRGKIVVQAYLVNRADRPGQVMAIGSFHDAHDQPMTRPFQMIELPANDRRVVQFVGPEGSSRGTIFVGDVIY